MAKKASPAKSPPPAVLAPPDPPVGVIHTIPLSLVVVKSNVRKVFDKVKLAELAESVRRHGVLQPILVRPIGFPVSGYQLVAGERRFRATTAAGFSTIPANVRQMSDLEVLEVQVIENLQREDLHPLEEAEGFKALLAEANRNLTPTEPRLTVEGLAARIHRGRDYVYKRLKLAELPEEGKQAFAEGKFSLQIALLIARIPNLEVQKSAIAHLLECIVSWSRAMTYDDAANQIQRKYMLVLTDAPFDAGCGKLCPDAGPCTTCMKRTVNDRDLFGDVTEADLCTDSLCYQRKVAAAWQLKEEDAERRGLDVMPQEEAKKVFPSSWSDTPSAGYVKADEPLERGQKTPLAELLKTLPESQRPRMVLVQNPHKKTAVEVVKKAEAEKALRKAGLLAPKPALQGESQAAQVRRLERLTDTAVARIVDQAEAESIPRMSPLDFWRLMVALALFFASWPALKRTCARRGLTVAKDDCKAAIRKLAENSTTDKLCGLALELQLYTRQINYEYAGCRAETADEFAQALTLYRIDLDLLKKELASVESTSDKSPKAKKAAPASVKKAAPKPQAAPPAPVAAAPGKSYECATCGESYSTWMEAHECNQDHDRPNDLQNAPPVSAGKTEPKPIHADSMMWKDVENCNSLMAICENGRIKKPYRLPDGRQIVGVGGVSGRGVQVAHAYEVVDLSKFSGETWKKGERSGCGYHGMRVILGNRECVLKGPQISIHGPEHDPEGWEAAHSPAVPTAAPPAADPLFVPQATLQVGTEFRLATLDKVAEYAGQTLETDPGRFDTRAVCRVGGHKKEFRAPLFPRANAAYASVLRQILLWFVALLGAEELDFVESDAVDDMRGLIEAKLSELQPATTPPAEPKKKSRGKKEVASV